MKAALRDVARRVLLLAARGVLRLTHDNTLLQTVQVEALAGEVLDGVEHMQPYGFTAHALPGADAAILSLGGERQHPLAVAVSDRRHRLRGLQPGDVALYTDLDEFARVELVRLEDGRVAVVTPNATLRHRVELKRGRIVELWAGETMLRLSPAGVEIVSPSLTHNGVNVGDDHVHGGVVPGGAVTAGPQ